MNIVDFTSIRRYWRKLLFLVNRDDLCSPTNKSRGRENLLPWDGFGFFDLVRSVELKTLQGIENLKAFRALFVGMLFVLNCFLAVAVIVVIFCWVFIVCVVVWSLPGGSDDVFICLDSSSVPVESDLDLFACRVVGKVAALASCVYLVVVEDCSSVVSEVCECMMRCLCC